MVAEEQGRGHAQGVDRIEASVTDEEPRLGVVGEVDAKVEAAEQIPAVHDQPGELEAEHHPCHRPRPAAIQCYDTFGR